MKFIEGLLIAKWGLQMDYNSILNLFCGKQIEGKIWAENPFIIEDKAYATDFNSMVVVDKGKTENISPLVDDIKPDRVTHHFVNPQNKSLQISLPEVRHQFSRIPLEKSYDTFGEDITCKECDGHGVVDWEYKIYTLEENCPICRGDGLSSQTYKKPNGKFQMESGYFIDVAESRFAATLFSKLVQVSDILGEETATLIYQSGENGSSIFTIRDVTVLLMPCMKHDERNVIFKI